MVNGEWRGKVASMQWLGMEGVCRRHHRCGLMLNDRGWRIPTIDRHTLQHTNTHSHSHPDGQMPNKTAAEKIAHGMRKTCSHRRQTNINYFFMAFVCKIALRRATKEAFVHFKYSPSTNAPSESSDGHGCVSATAWLRDLKTNRFISWNLNVPFTSKDNFNNYTQLNMTGYAASGSFTFARTAFACLFRRTKKKALTVEHRARMNAICALCFVPCAVGLLFVIACPLRHIYFNRHRSETNKISSDGGGGGTNGQTTDIIPTSIHTLAASRRTFSVLSFPILIFFLRSASLFLVRASGRPKLNLYWRGFESPPPKIKWNETIFIAFARSHPDHFSRQIHLPNKFGAGASVDAQTRVFVVCGRSKTTNNSECVRHSSGRPNLTNCYRHYNYYASVYDRRPRWH